MMKSDGTGGEIMSGRDIRKLAVFNLKAHGKGTVSRIIMFAASIVILIMSSVFSGAVNKGLDNIRNQSQLHIMTAEFQDEETMKEVYDIYKDDGRIYEIGEGMVTRYGGMCENTEELFGEEKPLGYDFNRYLDYYRQYSDYEGELKADEVILPRYINTKVTGWFDYFDVGDFFDTKELIGKTISLEVRYGGYDMGAPTSMGVREFRIVGTLDNVAAEHSGMGIYISDEAMREFETFFGEDDEYNMYMVVKDVDDVVDIENERNHFVLPVWLNESVSTWGYIADGVELLGRVLFVFSMINAIYMTARSITKRMREFAIMKASGYEQSIINRMLAYEVAVTFAAGFAVAMLMSLLGILLLNIIKYQVLPVIKAGGYEFVLQPWQIVFSVLAVAAASVIAYGFAIEKITKTRLLKSLKTKKTGRR